MNNLRIWLANKLVPPVRDQQTKAAYQKAALYELFTGSTRLDTVNTVLDFLLEEISQDKDLSASQYQNQARTAVLSTFMEEMTTTNFLYLILSAAQATIKGIM